LYYPNLIVITQRLNPTVCRLKYKLASIPRVEKNEFLEVSVLMF
jgi:hypothetical protein